MEKTILYPFETHQSLNRQTYALAIRLARRLGARLVLFTVLPPNAGEEELQDVYLHLLQLHGHYQTHYHHWRGPIGVPVRQVIRRGDFTRSLQAWLSHQPADFLICQPHSPTLNSRALRGGLSSIALPHLVGEEN